MWFDFVPSGWSRTQNPCCDIKNIKRTKRYVVFVVCARVWFFCTFISLSVLALLSCFFSFPAELSGLLFIGDGILQVELPELRLMLVYTPHPTLQKITKAVSLIIHVATCLQKLQSYKQMSHPRSFIGYKYIRQKKKNLFPHLISPGSCDAEETSPRQPKAFCIHGNCGCDSLVYSFQRRCHNSYCACLINHSEDGAAVIWCQQYYLG